MEIVKEEKKILDFWKKNKIFEKSLENTKKGPSFVFYDGPITVNANPGIHHVLARIYKDIIPRFKTMQGFYVERKNGWDTHGLPVEIAVEKKLGFKTKKDIDDYGIAEFNQECKKTVNSYLPTFKELTEKIAYWIDMKNPYITYNPRYVETIWWILKQIWKRGLLYEDFKVVPWCVRCGTILSSHELALGYRKIQENSVYIKLKLKPGQKLDNLALDKNSYFLSWTTTPWTLPGNVALACGQNLTYCLIGQQKEFLILAKSKLGVLEGNFKIIKEFKGKTLTGLKYEPLFKIAKNKNENSHKVYPADFISEEEGTGIVHTASMYGADDFSLAQKYNLPCAHTVSEQGEFNSLVENFKGKKVKDKTTEKAIISYLKKNNSLFKEEMISHDYPFCWRCKEPLLYYAKKSWFIKVSEVREKLLKENQKINWMPNHLKEGRFGEWLRGAKDWAISRERYWGTPLPIWQCQGSSQTKEAKGCGNIKVIGSYKELEKLTGKKIGNPHRPYIDKIEFKCPKCGGTMKRVPYVIDVWFDSGSMPFSQHHWPFNFSQKPPSETKNSLEAIPFPADYIAEAIDQTRGWFYTLLAISVLLGYSSPYKNVLCLGHVVDKKGEKMSKSKGNIVDPNQIIDRYGADALRWYFFTVNQPEDTKRFNEKEVKKAFRKILILKNSFRFLKFYSASQKKLSLKELDNLNPKNILDKWLLAKNKILIQEVTKLLENYQIVKAARLIEDFLGDISYKYIHWSRSRFRARSPQKKEVGKVLTKIFLELSKITAPFIPFSAENIYLTLKKSFLLQEKKLKKSAHLETWPKVKKITSSEKNILKEMVKVEQIIGLGLRLRKKVKIKLRQPLSELKLNTKLSPELLELIKKELNVKKVTLTKKIDKRKGWVFDKQERVKISLNITLSKTLREEGVLREIIRHIQILRKKARLNPQEKIVLFYKTENKNLASLLKKQLPRIKKTSGVKKLVPSQEKFLSEFETEFRISGKKLKIAIKKS